MKVLGEEEWKTLLGLERASMKYGFADPGMASRLAGIPVERVNFALDRLNRRDLVRARGANFTLTFSAIEALALREYVTRGLISALGAIIAKGKESDVYEAFTEEGGLLAVKFFKIGRTSFRDVARKRSLGRSETKGWIARNYEAAKSELSSLRKLEGLTKSVPRAIAHDRSTVLLEELSGVKLVERPELDEPSIILKEIIDCVRVAYREAGIINADLSEYNILTDGRSVWLIDWPQAVRITHPNSAALLQRDLHTVLKFFRKVYRVLPDETEVADYVVGKRATLTIRIAGPAS